MAARFSPSLAAALAFLLAAVVPGHAQVRLLRTYGTESGLASAPVWAIAQDSVGFLWIGTQGGLFRFDGTEFRRWAPDSIRKAVSDVSVSPDGRVAALEITGRVFEITAAGARGIDDRLRPGDGLNALTFDRRGGLWYIGDGDVRHLRDDGSWEALSAEAFDGERLRFVKPNRLGAIDVLTNRSVWRIRPNHPPRRLIANVDSWDITSLEDGRSLVLEREAVIEVSPEGQRLREFRLGRVDRRIGLVERQGTIWVVLANWLLRIRPGEPTEAQRFSGEITYGGAPFVDREGSLWVASNLLHQFPEPETRIWTQVGGVELESARFVEKSGSTLWFGTWWGHIRAEHTASGWDVSAVEPELSHLCSDVRGRVWSYSTRPPAAILEMRGSDVIRHPYDAGSGLLYCAADRSGGVWLGFQTGIVHVSADAGSIRTVRAPLAGRDLPRRALSHDTEDRLWVGVDPDRICSASVPRLLSPGDGDPWTCDVLGDLHAVRGMVELPSGMLWAGTQRAGLLAYGPEGWRPLRMDSLPTQTVLSLAPSPLGGAWMAGHGFLQRIAEGADGRPVVVERLTSWHGVPGPGTGDILEEKEGRLWIARDGGIVAVPAEVRTMKFPSPPVALVEAIVDEEPVPTAAPLELPHDRNRLELRFAALSFRNRSQLRHQVRLGPDDAWAESHGTPVFRWMDLGPGAYEVEYRASLDGVHWSAEPARFAFTILRPWYGTPWATALFVLLAAALAWAVHRARVAHVLALERQRTRIAMDLHDEVGSGLASVGILSSVLAGDGIDGPERRRLAVDIASAAEELGNALSDIVWSLDPQTATLDELASRLTEHGERLCADANVELATQFPASWPDERVDVAVRRNVLLVGLEALHNAVRHAGADRIELSLLPHGREWQLMVHDDGRGFEVPPVGANGRRGHGLRSMQWRAEEIGGDLDLCAGPGQGTTVILRFSLGRKASRSRRRLRITERGDGASTPLA